MDDWQNNMLTQTISIVKKVIEGSQQYNTTDRFLERMISGKKTIIKAGFNQDLITSMPIKHIVAV